MAQWLGVRLPMQGTWVRALVREDPTCRGATKPMRHNSWDCALEPTSHNYWARVPQLLKLVCLEPVLHNERSHRNEKPAHRNEEKPPLATTRKSPRAATETQYSQKYINKINKFIKKKKILLNQILYMSWHHLHECTNARYMEHFSKENTSADVKHKEKNKTACN